MKGSISSKHKKVLTELLESCEHFWRREYENDLRSKNKEWTFGQITTRTDIQIDKVDLFKRAKEIIDTK